MSPGTNGGADHIRLVLPAEPAYGRIARIATTTLAMRLGIPFPEIEDLRLAVDEAVILLLLRPEARGGDLTLSFTVTPDELRIDAATQAAGDGDGGDGDGGQRTAHERFEALVPDSLDAHTVDLDHHRVQLVKRRS